MPQFRDDTAGSSETPQTLARFIFRLPSFLPLPDGTQIDAQYPSPEAPATEQTPFAIVRLHQVEMESDELAIDYVAADAAVTRIVAGTTPRRGSERPSPTTTWHTVADVITTWQSADAPPGDWDGRPQHLGPREDAVMRAVDAVRTLARAVRLCEERRVILPSYEKLPLIWLRLGAPQEYFGGKLRVPPDSEWEMLGTMLLDHTNIGGAEETDPARQRELYAQSSFWAHGLKVGNPALLAREQLIVAERHLHHEGEYAAAIVSAATAVEVMTDSLLSALMWEEFQSLPGAPSAKDAAARFEEGKSAVRVTSELGRRLHGDWNSPMSPWQRWRSGGAKLRNRIVHGGYQPTRAEADHAIQLAHQLERFTFDRLAARANTYPRVTLMLVAQSGLERRGKYHGRIRRFSEQVAPHEPSWSEGFAGWHKELIGAMV